MDSFMVNPPRWSMHATARNHVLTEEQMDLSRRPRALGANFPAPAAAPGPTNSSVVARHSGGAYYSGPEYTRRSGDAAVSRASKTTDCFADLLKAAALLGATPSSTETTDTLTVGEGVASSDLTTSDPNSGGSIRSTRPSNDSGTSSRTIDLGARPAVA